MVQGQLLNALDERLRARGGFDEEEVEKVLHLDLLCSYPDPSARPSMRQVVKVLQLQLPCDSRYIAALPLQVEELCCRMLISTYG